MTDKTFDELQKIAFPDHVFSVAKIREYAYAKKAGKPYPPEFEAHLAACNYCQKELRLMWLTDPLLNGEHDEQMKSAVRVTRDPAGPGEEPDSTL